MGAFLGHFKKKFSSMSFLKKKILPAAHYFLSMRAKCVPKLQIALKSKILGFKKGVTVMAGPLLKPMPSGKIG